MSNFQVLGLGGFMISAAHYVKDGPSVGFCVWIIAAIGMVLLGKIANV